MNVAGIAVDDSAVYWTDNEFDGTVMAAPKSGGAPHAIASGQQTPGAIALDASYVYFGVSGTPEGLIERVAKSGGTVETVASISAARSLALDVTNVYATTPFLGGQVISAPLGGGTATILADAQPNARQIAVYQGSVYWANQGPPQAGQYGSIMKVPAGGGVPSVVASNEGGANAIAVDSSGVYWGDFESPDQGLMMVPLAGGTPMNLTTDPIDTDLAIDDIRVYFANKSGDIKSILKASGVVCTVATGQLYPSALTVDDSFVYWTPFSSQKGSASVWRASKDCCLAADAGIDASTDASTDGSSSDGAVDDGGSG